MVTIDLRPNSKLPCNLAELFNKIAIENIDKYNDFIGVISKSYKNKLEWWVSGPGSRNTIVSSLFYHCCCIIFIKTVFDNGQIVSTIITDSKALKNIIKQFLPTSCKTKIIYKPKVVYKKFNNLKTTIKPVHAIISLFLSTILEWFKFKTIKKQPINLSENDLILIDTFFIGNDLTDKYYTGIMNFLTQEEKKNIYFLPTFYGKNDIKKLIKDLRKYPEFYIIKQDFLKLSDFFLALKYFLFIYKTKITLCFFNGTDVSSLVQEDLQNNFHFTSAYKALLNFYFVKRLKEQNIKIKLFINWFENQVIDKGLNKGFNSFYPTTASIGFQGFIPPKSHNYLCAYPAEYERQNMLLPDKVVVVGEKYINNIYFTRRRKVKVFR